MHLIYLFMALTLTQTNYDIKKEPGKVLLHVKEILIQKANFYQEKL